MSHTNGGQRATTAVASLHHVGAGITLMLSGLVALSLSTKPSANSNLHIFLKIEYVVTILHQ